MNDLRTNAKFALAQVKSGTNSDKRRELFNSLSRRVRAELKEKGYWSVTWDDLEQKAFNNNQDYMNQVYIGSKREKMEYDYR